jgi:hypothetical protein
VSTALIQQLISGGDAIRKSEFGIFRGSLLRSVRTENDRDQTTAA